MTLFQPHLRSYAGAAVCTAALLFACGDGEGRPIRAVSLTESSGGQNNAGGRAGGGGNTGQPSADCDRVLDWPASDVSAEQGVFSAVDTLRALGIRCDTGASGFGNVGGLGAALPALVLQAELTCSARLHARDMAERGYFSEVSPEGEEPDARMREAGYGSAITAEVIAQDQAEAYLGLRELFEQQGEACGKLLDPRLTAIGVGKFENYWTIDLAGPRTP